jgi:D-tyrosyl-tRNA(Tyr) deacylase
MRAVVQRVSSASVRVDGEIVGEVGRGLLVLLGVRQGDSAEEARWLADKIAGLRILEDPDGKMNRSVVEDGLGVLVVSQFTLYGDVRKGRRPSFVDAAPPEVAEPLYERFCAYLQANGVTVGRGRFRKHMHVSLVNDGPVTLILDSP